MGLLKRSKAAPVRQAPTGRAVVAAAFPLAGPEGRAAWQARSGSEAWQREAWYFYDAVGEMRFATNWIANAISRAMLFAAEKDLETGQLTGPTDDARVQAVADQILGGPEQRPQLQQLIALHWQVAGETFILVQAQGRGQPDRWLALPSRALTERGGKWKYTDPFTGVETPLDPARDKLVRVWSPHPNEQTHADSAVRAAIPILREIEKTSQNVIARLDSRIAGNGMLFMPQEMDFPRSEGEPADAAGLVQLLMDAAEAAIQRPGTAAAQVPITVQVPGEMIGQIQHLDLATDFDAAVSELRLQSINRLGRALDMPKEVALGEMSDANHWTGWQIEELTFKIHIEPLLRKLSSAFTTEYLRPVLESMGIDNPERFVLDWDITEVTARPDRGNDLRDLHDRGLISNNFLRDQFGIPDEAIPDDEEARFRLLERLVTGAPTLLADPTVARELLGLEIEPAAAAGATVAEEIENPDDSEAADDGGSRALPERPSEPDGPDEGLVAAAELVVFDALSRAGGRLLTRPYRGRFGSVDKWALHTVIPHEEADLPRLLEGSFQFTDNIAHAFGHDPDRLRDSITDYVRDRIRGQVGHDRETLRRYL